MRVLVGKQMEVIICVGVGGLVDEVNRCEGNRLVQGFEVVEG